MKRAISMTLTPLLLAAAVSGGMGWYDTKRPIAFPGFTALATADNDIGFITERLRAAYLLTSGTWYLKPQLDLNATELVLNGVSEQGAGGVSLIVQGNNETVLSASPALELGTQFQWSSGTLVRPYVRSGVTLFDNNNFALEASFEGVSSGVGPFRISTTTDNVVADISAGADIIAAGGAELKLFYDGRFGERVEENSGGVKASLPF